MKYKFTTDDEGHAVSEQEFEAESDKKAYDIAKELADVNPDTDWYLYTVEDKPRFIYGWENSNREVIMICDDVEALSQPSGLEVSGDA